ncbi:non-canonical purine NTP pyrophosphatase, RdgB/HAM1 family [Coraliomargarita sinensis]|uniref:dITP/XTP pyrophosphatase n=1 Tax=Coraliomargarita sinensis TaxID=2174842 RepID=A0A317ZII4_9BACT|nr:RdgB/HAM1 family non-canonical purine NTP pyrophosphatase [Coraliomargarita sinensis]PXA04107.1 non-canonical purine NTP pyrophosphatase, RdgB/HAM1 family [Coraliomargarita sinensis]
MTSLIIATGNPHKTEEFAQLLNGTNFSVESAASCGGMPEVVENGATFADNAQLKAEALRAIAPANAWVMADDSGLEVDALDGAPGIYSARYAGPSATDQDNLEKLLHALGDLPELERTARFRCVLCLMGPDGRAQLFDGTCAGRISEAPSGSSGFGYDPVFVPDGYKRSFAELGETIKGELSHRARAVETMRGQLSS